MEIFCLRHGQAVERGNPSYPDDSARPLTVEGKCEMQRVAKGMKTLETGFDVILSSPYCRALETAEAVAKAYRAGRRLKTTPLLAADADPRKLLTHLQKKYGPSLKILLVGHEPFLSRFVSLLINGNFRTTLRLKKAGLCKLSADPLRKRARASLDWLLTPRQLKGFLGGLS